MDTGAILRIEVKYNCKGKTSEGIAVYDKMLIYETPISVREIALFLPLRNDARYCYTTYTPSLERQTCKLDSKKHFYNVNRCLCSRPLN